MNSSPRLYMVRNNWNGLPDFPVPPGCRLRWFQPGDESHWTRIHREADKLTPITDALYAQQFSSDAAVLAQRQCFLLEGREVVGTATAWFDDDFCGERWGRLHWVAVVPSAQGGGFSYPLISAACQRLRELGHARAYLATTPERLVAIRVYRNFGFTPLIRSPADEELWRNAA